MSLFTPRFGFSLVAGIVLAAVYLCLLNRLQNKHGSGRCPLICPGCDHHYSGLTWLPLVSFLKYRTCPHCGTTLAWYRLPAELVVLAVPVWALMTQSWLPAMEISLVGLALTGITVMDISRKIVPNVLLLVLLAVDVLGLLNGTVLWMDGLLGLGIGLLVALMLVLPQLPGKKGSTLAFGDAKLVLVLTPWLGWIPSIYILFFAMLATFLVWLGIGLGRGFDIKRTLQFGPFVAVFALLFGVGRFIDSQLITHFLSFRF